MAAALDEPGACCQGDGPLPSKAWRMSIQQPFQTLGEDKGMGVADRGQYKAVLDLDRVKNICQPPVLGWTVAMEV